MCLTHQHPPEAPERGAEPHRNGPWEIAPNKLLKTKGRWKKDLKNEDTSRELIENERARKVLPMSS